MHAHLLTSLQTLAAMQAPLLPMRNEQSPAARCTAAQTTQALPPIDTPRGAPFAPTTLQTLPYYLLRLIFDILSPGEVDGIAVAGVTGTIFSRHAVSLSRTCRALNMFYRHEYVTSFVCIRRASGVGSSDPTATINRVLSRLKAVTTLAISDAFGSSRPSIHLFSGHLRGIISALRYRTIATAMLDPMRRTAPLTHVKFPGSAFNNSTFADIVSACPRLESLVLTDVRRSNENMERVIITDAALRWLLDAPCKRTLHELRIAGAPVTDAIGCRLVELAALTKLDISGVKFADSYSSLGGFVLMEELRVSMCNITDDALVEALSCMPRLRVLNVSSCKLLTGSCLPRLATSLPALTYLDVTDTQIIGADRSNTDLLEGFKCLETLSAGGGVGFLSPHFLVSLSPRLRSLTVTKEKLLQDYEVAEVISAMPQLEHLNLRGCLGVSDGIASAVSSLSRLASLILSETSISKVGLFDIAEGPASETIMHFEVEDTDPLCPSLANDLESHFSHDAVVLLDETEEDYDAYLEFDQNDEEADDYAFDDDDDNYDLWF
jgi:hypothetical protein